MDLPVIEFLFCKLAWRQKARGTNEQNMSSIFVLINHLLSEF